jgi:hypothetical protein
LVLWLLLGGADQAAHVKVAHRKMGRRSDYGTAGQ